MLLENVPVPVPSDVCVEFRLGLCEVAQQTPRAVTADPPSLLIFPPLIAETFVIEPGVIVLTINLAGSGSGVSAKLGDFWQDEKETAKTIKARRVCCLKFIFFNLQGIKSSIEFITNWVGSVVNGEQQILYSSLLDSAKYKLKEIGELYRIRWGIEEGYKMYKARVQVEAFSGIADTSKLW